MATELEQAVQKAMKEKEALDKAEKLVKDSEVTGGTIFWAIFWAVISPIVGVIYGIVNLVQGKANKGWTYIGIGLVGFVLAYLILIG